MFEHVISPEPPRTSSDTRSVPLAARPEPTSTGDCRGGSAAPPSPPSGSSPSLPSSLAELMRIADERRALDAREAALLADPGTELDALSEFGHHLGPWLAMATCQAAAAASRRVRIAQRVRIHYPDLQAAFDAGRIGWNHVEVFDRAANARIREQMAALIDPIVALAEVASFDRWRREVRGIADTLDADGGYDPAEDPANNWLRITPGYGGALDISGQLVGELAASVAAIVAVETDRVAARHRADAEAMGELDGDVVLGAPRLASRAQCAAEALGELIDRAVAVPDGAGAAPSPSLVVSYDLSDGTMHTDDGEPLSPTVLRWLLASATIQPIEIDSGGDPLRLGRSRRYASPDQRRALVRRDGGCVFPGCTRPPSWCDAHHVDHWDRGGPTDVENMALLCRHHHRVTHRPGWQMRSSIRGFEWITPSGRRLGSQRHHALADSPSSAPRHTTQAINAWKGSRIQLRRSSTSPG